MKPTAAAVSLIFSKASSLPGGFPNPPNDWHVASGINAIMVANPVPQGTVNVPFSGEDIVNAIGSTNLLKIVQLPAWDSAIIPLANMPEPKSATTISQLTQWTAGAAKIGYLTVGSGSEYDALAAPTAPGTTPTATGLYNRTQLDPSWPSGVPWATTPSGLGRLVDDDDVLETRVCMWIQEQNPVWASGYGAVGTALNNFSPGPQTLFGRSLDIYDLLTAQGATL